MLLLLFELSEVALDMLLFELSDVALDMLLFELSAVAFDIEYSIVVVALFFWNIICFIIIRIRISFRVSINIFIIICRNIRITSISISENI